MGLQCSYPTDDEIESLPRAWITNDDKPWDPALLDDDDPGTIIMPLYGRDTPDSHKINYSINKDFEMERQFFIRQKENHIIMKKMAYFTGLSFIS